MNDTRTTEYLKKVRAITLQPQVKLRMREELSSFADFHTVRVEHDARSIDVQRQSVFTLFTNRHLRFMKATLLIALMVGFGGTSLAAQNSVPGDFLYPVKIHVNENVRTALAVGANAEAKVQADLLNERLQEAEKLAAKGELKGEIASDVQLGVTAQLQKTLAASAQADAETSTEVRASVNDALATFTTNLRNNTEVEETLVAEFAGDINTYLGGLINAGVDGALGIELAGDISIESMVQAAEARLESLQDTISAAAEMNAEIKADFETKLEAAATFVANAQAELKANAEAQAEANAQRANDILGEIESALSLMGQVEIDQNTGHIIDIDLGGGASGNNGGVDVDSSMIIEGGASLENDMIDTDIDAQGSAAGSLGL